MSKHLARANPTCHCPMLVSPTLAPPSGENNTTPPGESNPPVNSCSPPLLLFVGLRCRFIPSLTPPLPPPSPPLSLPVLNSTARTSASDAGSGVEATEEAADSAEIALVDDAMAGWKKSDGVLICVVERVGSADDGVNRPEDTPTDDDGGGVLGLL